LAQPPMCRPRAPRRRSDSAAAICQGEAGRSVQAVRASRRAGCSTGPRLDLVVHLPAHIPVRTPKPHLDHLARPARRAAQEHRIIGLPCLVDGEGMEGVANVADHVLIVKLVFALGKAPQDRQAQAQRLDRVPDTDRFDPDVVVAKELAEIGRRRRGGLGAIVAIGLADIALGRHIGPNKAHPVDHAGKGSHGIGTTRIADEEDPVARNIARGQNPIGPLDLPVHPFAGQNAIGSRPVAPLDARLKVKGHVVLRAEFLEEFEGDPGIGFIAVVQGRHRAVEDDDVRSGPAPSRAAFFPSGSAAQKAKKPILHRRHTPCSARTAKQFRRQLQPSASRPSVQ
jgi:hypothetical protein